MPTDGRFAPAPSAPLHLGNLRTALLAWLAARAGGGAFRLRIDDLDSERSRQHTADQQCADLAALGLTHDGPVARQSANLAAYAEAFDQLRRGGHLYPCFCTRAEIREAASAPHGPPAGNYPGTCRDLTAEQTAAREAEGRRPAWRLRADQTPLMIHDRVLGNHALAADDAVLRRADGVFGYQLAVVVDDHLQGVAEVVRGADLLPSSATQRRLQGLLGLRTVTYAHVPLMVGPDGARLAKRHGAATLDDARRGRCGLVLPGIKPGAPASPEQVRGALAATTGLAEPGESPDLGTLAERFRYDAVPTESTIMSGCSL